jgi:hypothetical protein
MRPRSRLPSFGEKPINGDMYAPGELAPPARFSPSTTEEAEEYTGPHTEWTTEWAMPKPVRGIPGDSLATYASRSDEFRKIAKERIFDRLKIIPTPLFDPEIISFGKAPPLSMGNFGQDGDSIPERGSWGELFSQLVTGVGAGTTSFFEIQRKEIEARTAARITPIPASITQASTLLPLLIIGGVAWLMLRKKRKTP